MPIVLIRIDDRLIHGQVVVGWSHYLEANQIIVADDKVAGDTTQKMLYEMVVPPDMKVSILSVREAAQILQQQSQDTFRTIVLFSKPQDVVCYFQAGGPVKSVNVGGMRFEPGKKQIAQTISVNEEDLAAFRELQKEHIILEGRAVPTDPPLDISKFL